MSTSDSLSLSSMVCITPTKVGLPVCSLNWSPLKKDCVLHFWFSCIYLCVKSISVFNAWMNKLPFQKVKGDKQEGEIQVVEPKQGEVERTKKVKHKPEKT